MAPATTIQALLSLWCEHRPEHLKRAAATPGLAENWIKKLLDGQGACRRCHELQPRRTDGVEPVSGRERRPDPRQPCTPPAARPPAKVGVFPIETAKGLYDAPFVVLAHDTAPDPVFFYANRQAQRLFEMTWAEMVALPSRHSAEPLAREDRQRLLDRVSRSGYIDDYTGVRISRAGKRFLIAKATVWNLLRPRPARLSARRRHSTIGPPLPDVLASGRGPAPASPRHPGSAFA